MAKCLYVTHHWGLHDERWLAALYTLGFKPTALQAADDLGNLDTIRDTIRETTNSDPHQPILAGPLTPITKAIVDCSPHVVGLSWGFDMYKPEGLTWLSNLAGLIVDSTATRDIAINAGMPNERITLLPWGVDLKQFAPGGSTQHPEAWDLPSDSTIILSLREHEEIYRVRDVIEGFAAITDLHPNAALLIGHEGSLTGDLSTRAAELHISDRIRFIGKVSEDQLPSILRSAAVYITASDVDGTSVTLLQAMACSTPVLASDNPGNRDWVTPETGTLFTTGSPKSLAAGLDHLLGNPDRAAHLAKAAHELIEQNANWAANIQRLGDALRMATA